MPWTFPFQCFPCLGPSPPDLRNCRQILQTNLLDKVCLDSNLTNLFKNADARAAKIIQNADKPCLPKLQTNLVYSRQGLSILELALWTLRMWVRGNFARKLRAERRTLLSIKHKLSNRLVGVGCVAKSAGPHSSANQLCEAKLIGTRRAAGSAAPL